MAAYTQAQLDALRAAIATGVTRVEYDGRVTQYRSLAEMRQIEADMTRAIAGTSARPRYVSAGWRR